MTTSQTGVVAGLKTATIIASLGIGIIATGATVAGFFGDTWWGFDLMANFRWHLMWIALFTAIIYALTSKGWATIAFLIAVAINGFVIAPLWFGSQPAGTGEDGVSVVHADLSGGLADVQTTLQWIFDTQADVIITSGVTGERMLPLTVEGSPYTMIVSPLDADARGVVVLAKGNHPVRLVLTEEFDEPVYSITVPSGAGSFEIVTAWGQLASDATRAERLAARLESVTELASSTDNPVAIIGNIGATRFTAGMRDLRSNLGVRDATEGLGYLSTWPVSDMVVVGGWIGLPIDIAFMSPEITPLSFETGPDIGTSHLPVSLTIGPTAGG